MSSLPLRPLREDDAEQVAALFVAAYGEARRLDPEEIRSWMRNDELDAENAAGALRVYERAGMRRVRQNDNWDLEL